MLEVPPAETLWEVVVRGGNMVLLSIGSPGVKVSTYSSIEELTESYACFAGPIAGSHCWPEPSASSFEQIASPAIGIQPLDHKWFDGRQGGRLILWLNLQGRPV